MLCLIANTLFAEVRTYKGNVKDDSGNPLEFVNVTLQNLNDSTLIDGAVTDAEGKFSVRGYGNSVFLRVSAMGFEDRIINNPTPNLGDISLAPASYMLGEVVVKGSRPMAKLKGDGVQIPVSGTYLANTGTALEVLGKLPFVTKNGSAIEVLGKGTPLIYVNGRQVRDMSELDQLTSTQVKNIDVITNPGEPLCFYCQFCNQNNHCCACRGRIFFQRPHNRRLQTLCLSLRAGQFQLAQEGF